MNYCRKCGAPLPENAKFCTHCGTPVEAVTPAIPQAEEVVEEMAPAVAEAELLPDEPVLAEEDSFIPQIEEGQELPLPEPPEELPVPEVSVEAPAAVPVPPPPVQDQAPPPAYPPQPPVYAAAPPPVQGGQPPYGYGAPPPPYPPQHPAYPQGQQPPMGGYPGYPPAAPPKKKKRWWIPVVIIVVILALLAGAWALFGKQISNVFASTEKRWKNAETSASLIPQDSLLQTLRETSGEMLKQDKYGSRTELTVDVKADALPDEMKEVLTALTALRFSVESKVDTKASHFHTSIGLGKRGDSRDALSLNFYDAEDHLVIDVPQILRNPLAVSQSTLEDLTGSEDLGISFNDLFTSSGKLQESMAAMTGKTLDEIEDGLKKIFIKHAGSPELVKGESVTVGSVTQKLDYYKVTIPEDRFPAMMKEMITYLRDSKEIKKLLEDLDQVFGAAAGGYGDSVYDSFVESMNDALKDLENNPEDFKVRTERLLYVDSKNNPVGGQFTFTKVEGREEEKFVLTGLHTVSGADQAQLLRIEIPDGSALEFQSEYTVKSGRYNGTYTIRSKESEWYETTRFETVAKGTFTEFELRKAGTSLYPVGQLTMEISMDDAGYGAPDKIKLTYQGKVESSDRLEATLEIAIGGDMPVTVTLGMNYIPLAAKDIVFNNVLPPGYIDLADEDALMGLMMDESIMTNLMSVLDDLGIDLDAFGGLSGGGSWDDDWDFGDDDWDDDWDFDWDFGDDD